MKPPGYEVEFDIYGADRADLWVRGPDGSQVVALLMRMKELGRSAGKAVAACLIELAYEETAVAWISDVRAPASRKGAGIGTTLMVLALDAMREAGVEYALLDARPPERENLSRLLSFYRRHGFVLVRECAGITLDWNLMIAKVSA